MAHAEQKDQNKEDRRAQKLKAANPYHVANPVTIHKAALEKAISETVFNTNLGDFLVEERFAIFEEDGIQVQVLITAEEDEFLEGIPPEYEQALALQEDEAEAAGITPFNDSIELASELNLLADEFDEQGKMAAAYYMREAAINLRGLWGLLSK